MKNYYEILGISQGASGDEIKKAYKKLSLKCHPDKHDGKKYFVELFKEVNEANRVLSDEFKRADYDYDLRNYLERKSLSESRKGIFSKHRVKKTLGVTAAASIIILAVFLFFKPQENDPHVFAANGAEITQPKAVREAEPTEFSEPVAKDAKEDAEDEKARETKKDLKLGRSSAGPKRKIHGQKEGNPGITGTVGLTKPTIGMTPKSLTPIHMYKILSVVSSTRRLGAVSNCVRIIKTKTSNVTNGFALAPFLKQKGYTIVGRETVKGRMSGFRVERMENCIIVTLGSL